MAVLILKESAEETMVKAHAFTIGQENYHTFLILLEIVSYFHLTSPAHHFTMHGTRLEKLCNFPKLLL